MDLYEIHCNDTIDSLRVLIACWGSQGRRMARAREDVVTSQTTHVLPLEFGRRYPVLKRGDGVWVEDESGKRYLDAMSGGSMAATLGTGRSRRPARRRCQPISASPSARPPFPRTRRRSDSGKAWPSGATSTDF